MRLAIGLESTDDTLRALDKAIAAATGEARQLQATADDALNWLLHSPFDRSDNEIRQKVIATVGADAFEHAADLQATGYVVKPLEALTDGAEMDALWCEGDVSDAELATFAEQNGKIIWSEQALSQSGRDQAAAHNMMVIADKQMYTELIRLRQGK